MAGLFMDGNGMIRKKKADVFAVKRSKEDGSPTPSLLSARAEHSKP